MDPKIPPIVLLNFVNGIGFSLLIPVLPFIVREQGQSDAVFGLIFAAYPLFQFFGAPILGNLADYYGRKPVLIISQAGTLASWVIFALAYFSPWPLALITFARLVDGATGGNISVANAYVSDVTTPQNRTRVYGIMGAAFGLALMVGPAIGSLASSTRYGFLGLAVVATLISTVTLFAIIVYLKESLPHENRIDSLELNLFRQLNLVQRTWGLKNVRPLSRLFAVRAIFSLVFSSYITINVLWFVDRLGLSQAQVGWMLLVIGAFVITNQLLILPLVVKWIGDAGTLVVGFVLMPIGLFLFIVPNTAWALLIVLAVLSLGIDLLFPTIQSVISKTADIRQLGEAQGVDAGITAGMMAVAPMIAGILYANFRGGTFIILAIAAALGLIWLLVSRKVIHPEKFHRDAVPEMEKIRGT